MLLVLFWPRKTKAAASAAGEAEKTTNLISELLGFDFGLGFSGGIGGSLPFLGFSPQGPFGSGAFTPVRNYRFDQQRFVSPFDAAFASIGGWGGGIGNQYDPSGWDGYSAWDRNLIPMGNGLTAADFALPPMNEN